MEASDYHTQPLPSHALCRFTVLREALMDSMAGFGGNLRVDMKYHPKTGGGWLSNRPTQISLW
jgi:hypothetical protein